MSVSLKDEGGFTIYLPFLPGCINEGNKKEDVLDKIKEAIGLYLEPVDNDFTFSPDTEITEIAI
jgi:predicted RNase H-like HicB family nuclease